MKTLTVNAKSILAGVITFVAAVAAALPGSGDVGSLTAQNWLTAAIAGVLALNAVWTIPNADSPPKAYVAQPVVMPAPFVAPAPVTLDQYAPVDHSADPVSPVQAPQGTPAA